MLNRPDLYPVKCQICGKGRVRYKLYTCLNPRIFPVGPDKDNTEYPFEVGYGKEGEK